MCLLRILVATLLFYAAVVGLLFTLNFPVWASVRRLLPRLLNKNGQWGLVTKAIWLLLSIPLGAGALACEVWRQVPSALASFSADRPPRTLMAVRCGGLVVALGGSTTTKSALRARRFWL